MNFYSHQFILFFLLSVSIYFILPHRVRWIFLLASQEGDNFHTHLFWSFDPLHMRPRPTLMIVLP